MKKKILIIFIVLFALLVIIGVATSGDTSTSSKDTNQTVDSIAYKDLGATTNLQDSNLTLTFNSISNLNDSSIDFNKIMNENISKIKLTLNNIKSLNDFKDYKNITVDIKGNVKYGKDNTYNNAILSEISFDVSKLKTMDLATIDNNKFIKDGATSITINPQLKEQLNTSTIKLLTVNN